MASGNDPANIPYIIAENGFYYVAYKEKVKVPEVVVSAKGVANGLSEEYNDGWDFGPDSYSPTSTSAIPYTQTTGFYEAYQYAISIGTVWGPAGTDAFSATYPSISLPEIHILGDIAINTPITLGLDSDGYNIFYMKIVFEQNAKLYCNSGANTYAITLNGANFQTGILDIEGAQIHTNPDAPCTTGIYMEWAAPNGLQVGGRLNLKDISVFRGFTSSGALNPTFTSGVGIIMLNYQGYGIYSLHIENVFGFNMNALAIEPGAYNENTFINSSGIVIHGNVFYATSCFNLSLGGGTLGIIEQQSSGGAATGITLYDNVDNLQIKANYFPDINFSALNSTLATILGYTTAPTSATINRLHASIDHLGDALLDTNVSLASGGVFDVDVLDGEDNVNIANSSTSGTTAGTVAMLSTKYKTKSKRYTITFSGYENDTTTDQTIDFPLAFSSYAGISLNTTGLTISATTSGITITAPDATTTYSGIVIVEGY